MTKEIVSSGEHAIDVPLYIVRSRNATALRQSGKKISLHSAAAM
jgi:hypothetical protein